MRKPVFSHDHDDEYDKFGTWLKLWFFAVGAIVFLSLICGGWATITFVNWLTR